MAIRKPATKKPTNLKVVGRAKGTRQRKPGVPMPAEVKSAAGKALATFEEALMESSDLVGTSTRQLKSGAIVKAVRLGTDSNKHRATITVRFK